MRIEFLSRKFIVFCLLLATCVIAAASIGFLSAADVKDYQAGATPQPTSASTQAAGTVTPQATPEPLVTTLPNGDIKFAEWFVLKANSAANWDLLSDPDDDTTLRLVLKGSQADDPAAKHILLLYTRPSSSYDAAADQILSLFLSKKIPAAFTARVFRLSSDKAAYERDGLQALDFARQQRFDLIFSVGSDTTDFMYSHFRNESIPLVTVTSKDPVLLGYLKDYETGSGTNIAYTSLNVPIELQMVYLKQLMPNLKNIAVMYGDKNTSAKQTQVEPLRNIAKDYSINMIDVIVYNNNDRTKARADLAIGMPAAIIEIDKTDPGHKNSIFWITGSTEVFNEIETINKLSGDVPVLSAVPNVVQQGSNSAVLSIGVTFESNAQLAALYATDILMGNVKPGDLKVGVVSPPDIAINFMKAKQINLKIPFSFFESASFVYDYNGKLVREEGQVVN